MNHPRTEERTGFQEAAPWEPPIDLQTDFVMVYGLDGNLAERVAEWKARGYVVHLMTGISWGSYTDYLEGRFDGRSHRDEGQLRRDGRPFLHETADIPYLVPGLEFSRYIAKGLEAAVDAGVEAIHVEEPEFWVDAGYSPAFKREWLLYYGEEWSPPHLSPDAQYRASRLKARLYARCIERVAEDIKAYSLRTRGSPIRFYVPTHSLLNYCQFRIVSPESRLLDISAIDGYIAQVWTGTARLPNVYRGVRRERTFETAFLEYGVMKELVSGTGRRMWFLHDPIEDDPTHDWDDYRNNYFKTLIASLLHPEVSRYEVCPWPKRIFDRRLPDGRGGTSFIPPDYAAVLLTVFQALGDLEGSRAEPLVLPGFPAPLSVGLFLSDSAHFQRLYPSEIEEGEVLGPAGPVNGEVVPEDDLGDAERLRQEGFGSPEFSAFYGLALPLLAEGALVAPVQLDNLGRFPDALADKKVLVLSYEFQKPSGPDIHGVLAAWVREGGVLIYVGDGSDEFHAIRSWWNRGGDYANPARHLFRLLGLDAEPARGSYRVGRGVVAVLPVHPFSLSRTAEGAELLRSIVKEAIDTATDPELSWTERNFMGIRRGHYLALAVLEESSRSGDVVLAGRYLDLLDPDLRLLENPRWTCGGTAFLLDLDRVETSGSAPRLLAASARIEETGGWKMVAKSPPNVRATAVLLVKGIPPALVAESRHGGVSLETYWDSNSSLLRLRWAGDPDGVEIKPADTKA